MKSVFFIFIMIFFIGWVTYAQDSLTVDEAVQCVIKTHPAIKQVLATTKASKERIKIANSYRYPMVNTEALYARIGPVPELTIPDMGSFKFYPENNYDIHIAGRYMVFDFGKTDAVIELSKSRAESSQDVAELTKTHLAMQTIRTFYAILFLQKSLRVQDEQIAALNEHLLINQKRVAAGSATDFDVLTTQVRVAAAQNQKIDIENTWQKQKSLFRQLLSLPEDAPVLIRGEFVSDSALPETGSLFEQAKSQRLELLLALSAKHSAELQYQLSSLGNRPAFSVNAGFGFKNGYIPDLNKMQDNWVAGVRAEMPIFDGGRVSHQMNEAKATLLAEQEHLKDVEQQIRSEIEQAVDDVRAAQSKIEIYEIQLEQANEAVTLAKSRYEAGTITNLDLLDVETAQSASRLYQIQAFYRYMMSKVELDRVVGNKLF